MVCFWLCPGTLGIFSVYVVAFPLRFYKHSKRHNPKSKNQTKQPPIAPTNNKVREKGGGGIQFKPTKLTSNTHIAAQHTLPNQPQNANNPKSEEHQQVANRTARRTLEGIAPIVTPSWTATGMSDLATQDITLYYYVPRRGDI